MSGGRPGLRLLVGRAYRRSAAFRLANPRRIDVIGIGAPKTGTHSIAGMFAARHRTEHEPAVGEAAALVEGAWTGKLGTEEIRRRLEARRRRLWLEADVAFFNGMLAGHLAAVAPGARFVLTVREPISWMVSLTDHLLNNGGLTGNSVWRPITRALLPPGEHTPHDEPLRQAGLPPLATLAEAWAAHNRRALDEVPPERLMVVPMHLIGGRVREIEAFAGAEAGSLDGGKSHLFKAARRHGVIGRLDPAYLEDRVEAACGDLARRLGVGRAA